LSPEELKKLDEQAAKERKKNVAVKKKKK